ncbi:MAG TPA: ribosome silencing factor [Thermoflexales bacterium]|nr:ribosome silencing factor [Thermoflexales bacterium]HQX08938.1 ribosome silencing factor [Thermoflexales bacterium]HQY25851.1 ribosome silencing factor [Thermoflexales bacterium]HQZ51888.1 ribosome silencing factor [Thermoflexales bacterium]HRA52073.1 ribosome silencing factor [Thermoflexales bacterium]
MRKQASEVYNAAEGERDIPSTIIRRAEAPADPRALALGRAAATAADDKKAENTLLLDLRALAMVFDYFVICSAPSDRQLDAVASHVREVVRAEFSVSPRTVEGTADSGWILVDYGDVVVHIMTPRLRAYYGLETLWAHAPVLLRLQ